MATLIKRTKHNTRKGQHGMESTTIMLNPKTLDNTGVGYLELKWGSAALILFT